jgi:tetratricopeptide (TPR) repeat protein
MKSSPNKTSTTESLKQRLVTAMQLHVAGKSEEARVAYEALLADYPRQPDILHSLGTLHLQEQEWQAAADCLQQAADANPQSPRSLLPLAQALMASEKTEQAMEALAQLLALKSDHEEGSKLLHDLCLPETRSGGMKKSPINRLIKAHPGTIGLHSVAARLAQTIEDFAARLIHMDKIYDLGVRTDSFYYSYAISLSKNGRFERCMDICNEGIKRYPDHIGLFKMRGNIYTNFGQYDLALKDWARVIAAAPKDYAAMTPEDHAAHVAVGLIRLLTSDCREGYEEYAAHRDYAMIREGLEIPAPEWRGEKPAGEKLLLWSCQGIGDVVMFASLLPWVLAQDIKVTLALYPKMIPLFTRSFPGIHIIPYSKHNLQVYTPLCDLQAAFGQLMAYGLPHYTPSEHPPFLKADARRAQALREKYLALRPGIKKLVGIAWHTINTDTAEMRNIRLEQWTPLFSLPHVQYVSLQYGDHAAEIEVANHAFPGALHVDAAIDAFENIDDLSAQIVAMDEIVTIQNATAHLAGALGVSTTLMLCAASDWRWGLKRTDSRWYKSVHIERQEKLFDWKPIIERVVRQLEVS